MSPPRLLMLLGFAIVTVVMIVCYQVSNMTLQFGGLALGAAIFLVGKLWEARRAE